jgi:F0F1-type ATP synthase assembly protein I
MNKWRIYAELSAAAFGFFGAILIGLFIGQWLDGLWGNTGLFTVAFIFLGLAGAVMNLMRTLGKIYGGNGKSDPGNQITDLSGCLKLQLLCFW